jgi:hypothetical protein
MAKSEHEVIAAQRRTLTQIQTKQPIAFYRRAWRAELRARIKSRLDISGE